MVRTQEVLKSFSHKSHHNTKCYGGICEEEQREKHQINHQDLDLIYSSHIERDLIDDDVDLDLL